MTSFREASARSIVIRYSMDLPLRGQLASRPAHTPTPTPACLAAWHFQSKIRRKQMQILRPKNSD